MSQFHNVLRSDGTIHQERQDGNMRFDLTTGEISSVFGQPDGTQTVIGPDGQMHMERLEGGTRCDLTNGRVERLF